MPCLILTGHPCVGKTTLAEKIKERALKHSSGRIQSVLIVNEEMACPGHTKAQCYATSHAEKKTRGALKACFDQAVVGESSSSSSGSGNNKQQQLVILDSMNYIKGFRYELFCISKAAGETHGVIWALNSMELSKEWNRARNTKNEEEGGQSYYSEKLMDELIQRYEPPDERNRWDKPLYRIDMRPQELKKAAAEGEILGKSVYNMHALSDVMAASNVSSEPSSGGDCAAPANAGTAVATQDNAVPKKKTFKGFKRAPKNTKSVPPNVVSSDTKPETQQTIPTSVKDDNPVLFPKNFLFSSATSDSTVPQDDAESVDSNGASGNPAQRGPQNRPPKKPQHNQPVIDPNAPVEGQIDAILDAFLLHVQPLVQGQSTQQHVAGSANVLHEMDAITQSVCDAIVQGQTQSTVQGHIPVVLAASATTSSPDQSKRQLFLNTTRQLPQLELRRLRKQYLRWVATHPPDDSGSEYGIAKSFLTYIEAQL